MNILFIQGLKQGLQGLEQDFFGEHFAELAILSGSFVFRILLFDTRGICIRFSAFLCNDPRIAPVGASSHLLNTPAALSN
jgi:hypothetical protein